jgi:dTDP-4-dehydrorhamnose 3,5-epimerase
MAFKQGPIEGVLWTPLARHADNRGWLCELFLQDELPSALCPVMAYLSVTEAGLTRGPHEHAEQTDCFCFLGPSSFRVYLWDIRPSSPTHGNFETRVAGASSPARLIVPPGVVHAYKNIGAVPGLVFNGPNRLYRGPGKTEVVDEIRHETRTDSPFVLVEQLSLPGSESEIEQGG